MNAHWCTSLWDLPDGLSNLEKLEMFDVNCSGLGTLPSDYKWLAGYLGSDGIHKVNVDNCLELFNVWCGQFRDAVRLLGDLVMIY